MNWTIFWILLGLFIIFLVYYRIERKLENESISGDHDRTDYHKAKAAYLQAQQNFELAEVDPQYIDIAISDLGISENRVNNELLKIRKESGSLKGGEHDDQTTTDSQHGKLGTIS